ncbi:MAG: serine/threonine-protein kinase [bacterium]
MDQPDSNSADGTLRGYAPECLREPWLRAVGGRGVEQHRVAWAVGFVDQTLRYLTALLLPEGGVTEAVKKVWRDPGRASLGSWGFAAKELAARVIHQPDAVALPVAQALLAPDGKTWQPLLQAISDVVDTRNDLAHQPGLPSLSSDAAQEAYERVIGPALGIIAEGLRFLRTLHLHSVARPHNELKLLTFLGPEVTTRPLPARLEGVRLGEPLLIADDGRVVELGPLLCVRPRDERPRPMLLHAWPEAQRDEVPKDPMFLGSAGADVQPSREWREAWPVKPKLPLPGRRIEPALGEAVREPTRRLEGVLVAGRYLVEEFIAQGGSAQVLRARDQETQQRVALKILHRPLQASASHRERLLREVGMLQRLDHPNVVRFLAFHEQSDHGPIVAMELGQGVDLARLFAAHRPSEAELLRIVLPLLDTLAELHALGIWHRDIKPANLLLDGSRLLLLDFGIARDSTQAGMTATLDRLGTRAFAAPEQLQGGEVGPSADLFAVGRLVVWMLTGQTQVEAVGALPTSLQAWVRRATRTSPAERFPSARDMGADLRRRALEGLTQGPPLGPGDTLRGLYRVVEQPVRAPDDVWEVPVHELGSGHTQRLRFLPASGAGAAALIRALRDPDPDRLVSLLGQDGIVGAVYRAQPAPPAVGRPAVAAERGAREAGYLLAAGQAPSHAIPDGPVFGMGGDEATEPGRSPLAFSILLTEALAVAHLAPALGVSGWFRRLEGPLAAVRSAAGAPQWLEELAREIGRLPAGAAAAAILRRAADQALADPDQAECLLLDLQRGLIAGGSERSPALRPHGRQTLLLVDAHPGRGARAICRGGRVAPLPDAWITELGFAWRAAALEALPTVAYVTTEQTFELGYQARRRPVAVVGYDDQHRGPASTRPFLLRAGGFISARGIPLVGLTDGATWRWLQRTGVRSFAEVDDPHAFLHGLRG